jgi:hypothetical protein
MTLMIIKHSGTAMIKKIGDEILLNFKKQVNKRFCLQVKKLHLINSF